MASPSRTLVVSALTILAAILAVAFHGIDNTSSLNLIFPLVLDGVQYLFGSSKRDESVFEYAADGLPLCNKCHCTPRWDQDPSTFTCPTDDPPPWQYPTETMDTLAALVPLNPFTLECNPYQNASCNAIPSLHHPVGKTDAVCGLVFQEPPEENAIASFLQQNNTTTCPLVNYTMQTFESQTQGQESNAIITHLGPCGACSTTQDLAAYMRHSDMVHKGRRCTNRVLLFGIASGVSCYQDLGFTQPCATIWAYNSLHTATVCRKVCVRHLFSPPNLPEPHCQLNECLQCDEQESGPIFSRFAGRTRRNSGLRTPILRPCEGLAQLQHEACPLHTVLGGATTNKDEIE